MADADSKSLQEKYAPENACFGCGPANPDGLHIRSFVRGDEVVAEWKPEPLEVHMIYPFELSFSTLISAFYEVACEIIVGAKPHHRPPIPSR